MTLHDLTSGPAEILSTASVTTFAGHPLRLGLSIDGSDWFLELCFEDDPSSEQMEAHTSILDGGVRIRCVNFDDLAGRGSATPVLLGEVGSHLLFLHFRVFRYGSSVDRTVHYTVYRVDKAAVDWTPASG